LTSRYEKEQFVFEVSDKGIGIPLKERSKVFQRFYRIGNEDTRNTKGTGLGLYIAKQIVKAHRGKIQILDNQPVGTIFKITLPS
jgi:two-component system, OmpR family, phosphate regulon sensor histidine kinase PhoR